MSAETELRLAIRATNPQLLQQLDRLHQKVGATGADAFERTRRSAREAANEIERVGHFGKFTLRVLEAFLLYKGFVFLKTQAEQFTRELVEMEHQIALTQTQLNNLGRDFRPAITGEVTRIATQTGVAFKELAQTQYEVVSANIDVADSFRVVDLTARASVAGGLTDASLAFNAALTQANAFGIAIADLNIVFDKQFNLIKRGIFSYEQYARVSGEIAIAFAQLGQDINVANAALAAISQIFTGPQLREGATGLKNAALAIVENADAFAEFGFVLHDNEGNFRNFIDILTDLQSVLTSLSPREQQAILLELFDEKRARRGIQTLLREMDSLNQFYVEQMFALGDMNQAYETVNESLLQQARIFRNELIPAAEPFLRVLDDMLITVRALGGAVGGVDNLAVLASGVALGAAGGAAMRVKGMAAAAPFTVGHPAFMGPVHRRALVPFGAGGTLAQTHLRPSAWTMGAGALGGLLAFEQGRGAGDVGFAGAATTIGGAAVGGALFGGPAGAATFGGLAAIGLMMGELLEKEAEPVAKSFAEAFREALVNESMSVADAFGEAVSQSMKDSGFSRFFRPEVLFGGTVGQIVGKGGLEMTADWMRFLAPPNLVAGLFGGPAYGVPSGTKVRATQLPGLQDLIRDGRLSGVIQAGEQARMLAERTSGVFGINPSEAGAVAIRSLIERIMPDDLAAESMETARALETLVRAMVDAKLNTQQQADALDILNRGFVNAQMGPFNRGETPETVFRQALIEFSDFIRAVQQGPLPQMSRFGVISTQIDSLVQGDLQDIVDVFEDLGESGKELAAAFERIIDTQDRWARLQHLLEISFTTKVPLQGMALQGAILGGRPTEITRQVDFLDILNKSLGGGQSPITREELAEAFLASFQRQLSSAFGTNIGQMDRGGVIDFLVNGSPQMERLIIPSATGLSDSLIEAADAIDAGLITSLDYTSEQLRSLGDAFDQYNRQIFKIGIVQEFQSLAEIAGFSAAALQPILEEMVKNIEIAGTSFAEIFADPRKLADLLAEVQFGDIQVDNSTRNIFTIRVDAAMNTEQIVRTAELLVQEINKITQEAASR